MSRRLRLHSEHFELHSWQSRSMGSNQNDPLPWHDLSFRVFWDVLSAYTSFYVTNFDARDVDGLDVEVMMMSGPWEWRTCIKTATCQIKIISNSWRWQRQIGGGILHSSPYQCWWPAVWLMESSRNLRDHQCYLACDCDIFNSLVLRRAAGPRQCFPCLEFWPFCESNRLQMFAVFVSTQLVAW